MLRGMGGHARSIEKDIGVQKRCMVMPGNMGGHAKSLLGCFFMGFVWSFRNVFRLGIALGL